MKPHPHTVLLIFAVSVVILVATVYGYMSYAMRVSAEKAVLARNILRSEEFGKGREMDTIRVHESTNKDRARLASLFVPTDRIVDFIETVESLGEQAGSVVSLSSIDADNLEGSEPGTLGFLRAHVDAEGSWASVMRTLALAELIPHAVSLDRVRLDTSSLAGNVSRRTWKMSFDITAMIRASNPSP